MGAAHAQQGLNTAPAAAHAAVLAANNAGNTRGSKPVQRDVDDDSAQVKRNKPNGAREQPATSRLDGDLDGADDDYHYDDDNDGDNSDPFIGSPVAGKAALLEQLSSGKGGPALNRSLPFSRGHFGRGPRRIRLDGPLGGWPGFGGVEEQEGEDERSGSDLDDDDVLGTSSRGRAKGTPNIKWTFREEVSASTSSSDIIQICSALDDWDWARICGGQKEGTVLRSFKCISHRDCGARIGCVRDAIDSEWRIMTNGSSHASTARLPYTGKGLSAEFVHEIDAMLMQVSQIKRLCDSSPGAAHHSFFRVTLCPAVCFPTLQGKGPEYISSELTRRYGPNSEKSDQSKFARIPSATKIKSYKVSARPLMMGTYSSASNLPCSLRLVCAGCAGCLWLVGCRDHHRSASLVC